MQPGVESATRCRARRTDALLEAHIGELVHGGLEARLLLLHLDELPAATRRPTWIAPVVRTHGSAY